MMTLVLRIRLVLFCVVFTACSNAPNIQPSSETPEQPAMTDIADSEPSTPEHSTELADALSDMEASSEGNPLESQGLVTDLLGTLIPKEEPPPKVNVELTGVEDTLLNNVRAYLNIYLKRNNERLSPVQIERLHADAPEEIKRALQPFGYYRVMVESELTPPEASDQPWQARYTITSGSPITIKTFNVSIQGEGGQDIVLVTRANRSPLEEGSTLEHAEYEKLKRDLYNLATERGYLEARWARSQIIVNIKPPNYHAEIYLTLSSGARYRFGTVTFEQETFQDDLLKTFITFEQDDFYHNQELVELRQDLINSDYFDNIDITKQLNTQTKMVDLTVNLIPRKKNLYRIRAGYGTDRGLQLGFQALRRYINSRAHRIGADLVLTEKDRHYVGRANYIIPLNAQDNSLMEFALQYEGEDIQAGTRGLTNQGETRLENATLSFAKRHQRNVLGWNLQETWGASYLQESYDLLELLPGGADFRDVFRDFLSDDEYLVLNPEYKALMPEISWLYRETDNAVFIRDGEQLRFGLKGARDGLASNVSFWQARLEGNVIRPLFNRGRVIARQQLGYTDVSTITVLNEFTAHVLPRSLQFRTGGDRTVRGYSYEELAGVEGGLVNGKHLFVSSVEYEHRILSSWSLATFFDVGNAFDNFSAMDLHKGTGVGVRWYSPVGLVRLDVAHSIDEEENPWRVHFMIGPEF